MLRTTLALLFSLFFSASGAIAESLSTETLLEKMIAAYGGPAVLEKLNAYEQLWELNAVARGEQGSDRRAVELPDRLRVELAYPSRTELRILDGNRGIKIYDGSDRRPAQGPMLDAMRLQRMRLYHPLILKAKGDAVKGMDEENGFYRLTLAEGNLVTEYFVNPSSYLIEQVTGHLNMGGRTMSFHTEYHDFRVEEGVMLPHREVKYAGQVNTAIMTLKETRFGKVDPTRFKM